MVPPRCHIKSDYVRRTVPFSSTCQSKILLRKWPGWSMRLPQSTGSCPFEIWWLRVALYLLLAVRKVDLRIVLIREGREGKMCHPDPILRVIPLVQGYTSPLIAVSGWNIFYQCQTRRVVYFGNIMSAAATQSVDGSSVRNKNSVHRNAQNESSWPVP
jgi:hypothetical protein